MLVIIHDTPRPYQFSVELVLLCGLVVVESFILTTFIGRKPLGSKRGSKKLLHHWLSRVAVVTGDIMVCIRFMIDAYELLKSLFGR